MTKLLVPLACSLLAATACTGHGSPGRAEGGPATASAPAREAVPSDVHLSPEPTPYAVPTTPATDRLPVVTPAARLSAAPGETSVPWRLIRLYDGGTMVAIFYAFGCNDPGRVEATETDTAVTIRVLRPPQLSDKLCLSSYREAVALAKPLGSRPLLHAT